jgi:hypothetical protein
MLPIYSHIRYHVLRRLATCTKHMAADVHRNIPAAHRFQSRRTHHTIAVARAVGPTTVGGPSDRGLTVICETSAVVVVICAVWTWCDGGGSLRSFHCSGESQFGRSNRHRRQRCRLCRRAAWSARRASSVRQGRSPACVASCAVSVFVFRLRVLRAPGKRVGALGVTSCEAVSGCPLLPRGSAVASAVVAAGLRVALSRISAIFVSSVA